MGKNKQITLTRVLSRVTDEWQTAGKLKATPYTMYKLEALGFEAYILYMLGGKHCGA